MEHISEMKGFAAGLVAVLVAFSMAADRIPCGTAYAVLAGNALTLTFCVASERIKKQVKVYVA